MLCSKKILQMFSNFSATDDFFLSIIWTRRQLPWRLWLMACRPRSKGKMVRIEVSIFNQGNVLRIERNKKFFPKLAGYSFLMNSFRFPCPNIRMAWASPTCLVPKDVCHFVQCAYICTKHVHFTRVTNSNHSTVSKESTWCSAVSSVESHSFCRF